MPGIDSHKSIFVSDQILEKDKTWVDDKWIVVSPAVVCMLRKSGLSFTFVG